MSVIPEKAIVQNEGIKYEPLPEGVYTTEVVDVELKEKQKGYKGEIVDKYWFRLGILDNEYRGKSIVHFTSLAYTAGFKGGQASKLYELVCAVMGEKIEDSKPFDVNTLIGGRLRIVVKHIGNNEGKVYANIAEVMKVDESGKNLVGLTEGEINNILPKNSDEKKSDELNLPDLGGTL